MRVVFTIWPNPSHLYPLVPLAWALQAAGHEVCVAAHPDIAGPVAAAGLPAVALGDRDAMPVPMGPGRPYPVEREKVARVTESMGITPGEREAWDSFSQFMLPAMWDFHPYGASPDEPQVAMDALVEFTRSWQPDLMLWDPCFPGAAAAARACGAAQARFITAPDYWGWSIDRMNAAGSSLPENPLVQTVGPVAERYGVSVDEEMLRGQWTVSTLPEGMRLPVADRTVSVRWIPYSGQTVMPDWLHPRPERPRVGISLGLSWRKYLEGGWDHIPVLFDAVSDLDIEVVATLNEKQLANVTSVPANVRTVDYLPLNQLVPTCSALIHHGGFASYAAAANARVPQLITDTSAENVTAVAEGEGMSATKHAASPVSVRHVTAKGAGLVLEIGAPSVDEMRKQIVRVLNEPSFQDGANSLYQDLLATPSPSETVRVLEKLTAEHRA